MSVQIPFEEKVFLLRAQPNTFSFSGGSPSNMHLKGTKDVKYGYR